MSAATPPPSPVSPKTEESAPLARINKCPDYDLTDDGGEAELSAQVTAAMAATAVLDALVGNEADGEGRSEEAEAEQELTAQVTSAMAATAVLQALEHGAADEEDLDKISNLCVAGSSVAADDDDESDAAAEAELTAQVTAAMAATAILDALTSEEQEAAVKAQKAEKAEEPKAEKVENKQENKEKEAESAIIETAHSETTTDSASGAIKLTQAADEGLAGASQDKEKVAAATIEADDDDDDGIEQSVEAFHMRKGYMHPDTVELAKRELRETPVVRTTAIVELRKLLHDCKDLRYNDDDDFLLIFLRACHFYPQSAFEKMRSIASFRKENALLVHGLMIGQLKQKFIEGKVVNVLKNCDQHGRRVMFVNCGEVWNPAAVPADDVFRMLYMVHLAAQMEPETQVRGVVCVMDFDGLSMKQVKALSPTFSKRLLTFIQDAMPLRMKEVHFVKQPFIFKLVWQLFKPFVREKLNKRMHFHGSDMKSLHKFLDPAILPANYKGTQPKIDYGGEDWWPALEKHEKFVNGWGEQGPAVW